MSRAGLSRTLSRDIGVGAGVGAFSGLLGVGGGVVLIPYLTGIRRLAQKNASATSLVLVFMSGLSGAITYALHGQVAWFPALFIVIGGLVGAWIGANVMQRLRNASLQIAFGLLLVIMAVRLLLAVNPDAMTSSADLPAMTMLAVIVYIATGLVMGVLSALFGIGGGIILLPVLVSVFAFSQQFANGTSLAVMVPVALLGAVRLTGPGLTDWRMGLPLGIGAIAGAILGALIATMLQGDVIRICFAILLVFVGLSTIRRGWQSRRGEAGDVDS